MPIPKMFQRVLLITLTVTSFGPGQSLAEPAVVFGHCCIKAHEDPPTGCNPHCVPNATCDAQGVGSARAGECVNRTPYTCTMGGSKSISTHNWACESWERGCVGQSSACRWVMGDLSGSSSSVDQCSGQEC